MPIYDYHCRKCNTKGEYLVKSQRSHPRICDNCGKNGFLERMAAQHFSIPKSVTSNPDYQRITQYLKAIGERRIAVGELESPKHGALYVELWGKRRQNMQRN